MRAEGNTITITLVTGTSTGLGKATALELARRGHHVFASMRKPEAGAALLKARDEEGLKLDVIRLNITDQASIEEAISGIEQRAGDIDVLVNNAGVSGGAFVEDTPMDTLRWVMETNFFGTVAMMQRVLPKMRERGSGTIINISSISGRVAIPAMSTYQSSKWALEAHTETLASEVARFGIRVALIEPGVILTRLATKNARPDMDSPYLHFRRRLTRFYAERFKVPARSQIVADAVYEAITTDQPKLRYLVGDDAIALDPARRAVSDETWQALFLEMPDDEYDRRFMEMTGLKMATAEEARVANLPEG